MDVVYYVAASLDGFIATKDGSIEWLAPFEGGAEDYGYAEFYASIDAVLLGRRSYEKIRAFDPWPYPDKPCWVFSRQEIDAGNPRISVTPGSPAEVMTELAGRGLRRIWLLGGGALAGSFRAQRLITEYVVSIIPVLLGSGVPLFAPGGPKEDLRLSATKPYANGVVQLTYLRAGRHG